MEVAIVKVRASEQLAILILHYVLCFDVIPIDLVLGLVMIGHVFGSEGVKSNYAELIGSEHHSDGIL